MTQFDSFLLFDGATGTEYQKRGLPAGVPSELFTLERPDVVAEVHRAYAEAGAMVVESNTFGANAMRLASHGLEREVVRLNQRAAGIARSSVPPGVRVAGSVGPLGVLLAPYGDVGEAEARDCFTEQIRALLDSGVDLILIETMLSLREAVIACEVANELHAPFTGATLTFEETPEGPRTPFGESPAECHVALRAADADFIGGNCGSGLEIMRLVGREFLECAAIPILLQPNAGIPEYAGGAISYFLMPEEFARFACEMAAAGIRAVGGCCGTTPEHVRRAAEEIRRIAMR